MHQRLHGADHPEIATSLERLAADLHALGEVAQARDLDAEAAAMRARHHRREGSPEEIDVDGGRSPREEP